MIYECGSEAMCYLNDCKDWNWDPTALPETLLIASAVPALLSPRKVPLQIHHLKQALPAAIFFA